MSDAETVQPLYIDLWDRAATMPSEDEVLEELNQQKQPASDEEG